MVRQYRFFLGMEVRLLFDSGLRRGYATEGRPLEPLLLLPSSKAAQLSVFNLDLTLSQELLAKVFIHVV